MPLLSPSGGLVYHARALRASEGRWKPFRTSIEKWLGEWNPNAKGLLLIGPSGGYSLPTAWLARFERIVAVDFDPLARRIFEGRHRECRIERWIVEDLFPTGPWGLDLAPMRALLNEHPDHAILFSNVLGQLALDAPDERRIEAGLGQLRALLEGRLWASYHDRLSSPVRPDLPRDVHHRDDVRLAHDAYAGGELSSHGTGGIGRGLACKLFAWECQKGYWNLIEACRGETLPSLAR